LEIGCGTGTWLVDFETFGADQTRLHGIDLDPYRSEKARTRLPAADIRVGDASNLPWPDEFFDLVLQSTVFTSILNLDMKRLIAAEMLRVLKPTGIILWYDFRYNNPKNANVRGIKAAEIRSLFKGCDIKLQTITLAPPIAKCLAKVSWITCLLLETIPALRTHYWGVIRKRPK
jgi:ubiquinone/menaquinone biosynthesis C-methylase UbiE